MNRLSPNSRPLFGLFAAAATIALAGLALAGAPALAQDEGESDPPAKEKSERARKGEARLARLLEGRVAGEPRSCIRTMPSGPMTTIDNTAYVFGRGTTIYVQRTRQPDQIDDRDTLVTQRFGGGPQLCRQDIAPTIDPVTQIFTGAVMFEDFVPYTRVESSEEG